MRKYDFDKAVRIIRRYALHPDFIEASMGMHADYYHTAEVVARNGDTKPYLDEHAVIGALNGSGWDIPVLVLSFKPGSPIDVKENFYVIECYTGESTADKPAWFDKFYSHSNLPLPISEEKLYEICPVTK